MSRSRNIKPGTFQNELLAECDPLARLLFIALWCEADREGRLEDRPKRIKVSCLPYDDCDANALLAQLAERGFIVRYQAANVGYIQITNFAKHQNPHIKEAASTIPAPDSSGAILVQASEIPERATLIPSSLIPDSTAKKEHVRQAARKPEYSDSFEKFWAVYPNKKGKQKAYETWRQRGLEEMLDELIEHAQMMTAKDNDWQRGYAPMGSTYLNGARWEDQPKAAPVAGSNKSSQAMQYLEDMTR